VEGDDDYFTGHSLKIEAIADFSPRILFPPDKPCQPARARALICSVCVLYTVPYCTVNQRYSRHPLILIYRQRDHPLTAPPCIQYIMSMGDRTSPLPLCELSAHLSTLRGKRFSPSEKKIEFDVPTLQLPDYPPPWHLALGHNTTTPFPFFVPEQSSLF